MKTCRKHGELKPEQISTVKYKNKNYRKCKLCISDKNKRYISRPEIKAKRKDYEKIRWETKKDEIKERRIINKNNEKRRESYKKNIEHYRTYSKLNQKKYRVELKDSYIKKVLADGNCSHLDIPDSLVRAKKAIMQLKKQISISSDMSKELELEEKLNEIEKYRASKGIRSGVHGKTKIGED